MKKYLLLLLLPFALLHATPNDVCASHPEHPLCQEGQVLIIEGIDGEDGVVDYSAINKSFYEQAKFMAKSSAGNTAVASIDFGTTKKGITEVGLGFGYSNLSTFNEKAGAIALKHGVTDSDAVIIKGWKATGNDANAVGIGFTHRF